MNKQEKLVLCGLCAKPIHVDDLGGISKEDGFFHADCMGALDKKIKDCKFDPKRKYSKSLSKNERKHLWSVYIKDKKEFKSFEHLCSSIVRCREMLG